MNDMWRCTVTGSSLCLPQSRTWFHGLRAQQRTASSLYLTEPGGEFNLPFGRWGDPPLPHIEEMHTMAPALLHMAEPGLTASDLALGAARALLASMQAAGERSVQAGIGVIIYCHASANEDVADAIGGRLQYELGLATPLVFCISQNLCSALLALRLASALLQEEPELGRALIVGAEKWIHPFVRSFGRAALFEDGAAAVMVEPAGRPGWQLGGVHLVNAPNAPSPFDSTAPAVMALMGEQAPRAIRGLMDAEGLSPDEIAFVVLPCLDPALCVHILREAGLANVKTTRDTARRGHLAAAEALANLHLLADPEAGRPAGLGLLWSVGLQGEAACCLLRYSQSGTEEGS